MDRTGFRELSQRFVLSGSSQSTISPMGGPNGLNADRSTMSPRSMVPTHEMTSPLASAMPPAVRASASRGVLRGAFPPTIRFPSHATRQPSPMASTTYNNIRITNHFVNPGDYNIRQSFKIKIDPPVGPNHPAPQATNPDPNGPPFTQATQRASSAPPQFGRR